MHTRLQLIGKPIYNIEGERYIGSLDGLYLDEDLGNVQYIHLGHQGVHSR